MSDSTNSGSAHVDSVNENQDDKVDYQTFKRAVEREKNLKAKLRELEQVLEAEKEKKLKESEDWKAVAELNERKAKEFEGKLRREQETVNHAIKRVAFERALGGKLKHHSYINHVDLESIVLNPETREIDEMSVKEVVGGFLKEHSHLVDMKGVKMPNQAGAGFKDELKVKEPETSEDIQRALRELNSKGLL